MNNGILLINKSAGMTSHDVVNKARRLFGLRQIGHSGTLDPLATGLLVLGIGSATKSLTQISQSHKSYIAKLKLGIATDTQDRSGKIIFENKNFCILEKDFLKTCQKFEGKIKQIPPMFSAKKQNGKKLYELARQGITVPREPKDIEIFYIKVLSFNGIDATLEISCSSGTYIRTLCHDIGQDLGTGAVMTELVRTAIGSYQLKDAMTLEELEKHGTHS